MIARCTNKYCRNVCTRDIRWTRILSRTQDTGSRILESGEGSRRGRLAEVTGSGSAKRPGILLRRQSITTV